MDQSTAPEMTGIRIRDQGIDCDTVSTIIQKLYSYNPTNVH